MLRWDRGQGGQRVTSVELFFDLVYVRVSSLTTLVVAAVAVSDTRKARAPSPG